MPSTLSICRQCLLKQRLPQIRRFASPSPPRNFPSASVLPRRQFSFTPNSPTVTAATVKAPESPLGGLANGFARGQQAIKNAAEKKARPFFPDISSKGVGYWLIGSAGLVFGIVVLGGLTRLTESGYDVLYSIDTASIHTRNSKRLHADFRSQNGNP